MICVFSQTTRFLIPSKMDQRQIGKQFDSMQLSLECPSYYLSVILLETYFLIKREESGKEQTISISLPSCLRF